MCIHENNCLTCSVRNCSILKPCGEETLSAITTFKTLRQFENGERIFTKGEPFSGIYFIRKGVVKIERSVPSGRSLIVKICGRGNIIGNRWILHDHVHHLTATALSDVVTCFVPEMFFKGILKNANDLEKQLANDYLKDLELMEQRSVSLAYKSVPAKIAEAIMLLSDIYCYQPKRRSFSIDLSRQDIADLAGTTKEQVSATLKTFSRNSLIRYSGKKINFIDLDGLKLISENSTTSFGLA